MSLFHSDLHRFDCSVSLCCIPESPWSARHRGGLVGVRPARQQIHHRLAQLRLHHHGPESRPETPGGASGEVVSAAAVLGGGDDDIFL